MVVVEQIMLYMIDIFPYAQAHFPHSYWDNQPFEHIASVRGNSWEKAGQDPNRNGQGC